MKTKIIKFIYFLIFLTTGSIFSIVTFTDAIRLLGPGSNGLQSGTEMVELWHDMSQNLTYDSNVKKFFSFMAEALEEFDFMQLYESAYFKKAEAGYRAVTIKGYHKKNSYVIALANSSYKSIDLSELGNSGGEYALKKNEKKSGDRSFSFRFNLKVAMKQFNNENGAAYLDGLLKILDPDNLKALNAPETKTYSNLRGESRKIIDELNLSFPGLVSQLNKYTRLRSLVNIKEFEGKKFTEFKMIGKLNEPNIEKDFEQLSDYIDDIRGLFKIFMYLNSISGNNIMYIGLDSFNEHFIWGFYTADGKIIPKDSKGQPVFSESFNLSGLTDYKFYAVTKMFANLSGLKIETGNNIAFCRYKKEADQGTISIRVTKIPRGKVWGSFYHIIPTWLIDIAIPSNIEDLMNKFSRLMEQANGGKGTNLSLSWAHPVKNNGSMDASISSEFLDNRFVRFGLKIWVRRFRPDEERQEDLRRLLGNIMGALLNDMRKIKS